jgi:hypothetical protein
MVPGEGVSDGNYAPSLSVPAAARVAGMIENSEENIVWDRIGLKGSGGKGRTHDLVKVHEASSW